MIDTNLVPFAVAFFALAALASLFALATLAQLAREQLGRRGSGASVHQLHPAADSSSHRAA